ncbi:MAG: GatB/YqeY domain-containing protein [Proteobacteria bacterium]|nr:GatB/YqeY domain-containing protein [Pseudomonadota bacterium]
MKNRIRQDLTAAMKAREVLRVSTLRLILSEIERKEKEKGLPAEQEAIIQILYTMIKKRKEAIELFIRGGRQDLADKEEKEIPIIESYLPQQMHEDEIRQEVLATIAELGVRNVKEIGKVMGVLSKKLAGKAQGSAISRFVKEELQKLGG